VTRLGDGEIVLHKFLCGLLQVGTVVVLALPAFVLLVFMGGVSFLQVAQVYAVTLGATVLSCAVGVVIALWREKTFQSVALTLLAIVLGVLCVEVLVAALGSHSFAGASIERWSGCLSPVRGMMETLAGESSASQSLPIVGHPSWGYLLLAVATSALLLSFGVVKMRAWNPRGEPIQQREASDNPAADVGAFRRIWDNPVLWREIRTFAYGRRPILIKVGYVLVFAILLWWLTAVDLNPRQQWKSAVVAAYLPLACFSIISLLLINAQALAAITSERDLRSIDLLLATDLSAKEFVYGKLSGIFYNTKEMVAAPIVVLALLHSQWGLLRTQGLIYSVIVLLVFAVFAAVLGIHAGLRHSSTRVAFANSMGTMFLLFVGILICLFLILVSGRFEYQWGSFILFIVLGSIGLWVSLSANAPSNAIALTATVTPFATFYCVIAFLMGDRTGPFLVGTGAYGFAVLSMLIPLLSEFDVATGRTSAEGA
jgi:hypothetical protein